MVIDMYYDIISLGEILIDFKVDENHSYNKSPGGAPVNVACVMAKYNCKATFIGKVGNDDLGTYLKDTLNKLNVDTSNILKDDEHITTQAFITTDKNGERYFSFKRENTADLFLNKQDIDPSLFKNCKIFHFGSLSLVNKTYETATSFALQQALENKCIVSFDPNYREPLFKNKQLAIKKIRKYLPYVDILKVSTEEAQMITKTENTIDAINALVKYHIPIILVTDGEKGAMFKYKTYIGNITPPKVKPVDTTGAGDIFLGAFLTMVCKYGKSIHTLSYDDLVTYTTKACTLASLSTEKNGAINSIPNFI